MGSSLQEQLLKAGLVTAEQVRRAETPIKGASRKPQKGQKVGHKARHRQGGPNVPPVPERHQQPDLRPVQEETPAEDREEKRVARQRKLARARIKTMLRHHRVNDPEADIPYHFLVGKYIRRIYVTAAQHCLLRQGELAIIPFGERHYLLSATALPALRELEPDLPIITHQPNIPPDADPNDAYTGYQVPDDLIW